MAQVLEPVAQTQLPNGLLVRARKVPNSADSQTVRWIDSVEDLEALKLQWDELAENAIRRNLSFEHSFLIPAFKHLGNGKVRVLVVEDSNISPSTGRKTLLGLLPVIEKKFYHLPITCLEVWKHDQCFDTTPLISDASAAQTLISIFDFLSKQKVGLLSLDTFSAEPSFQSALDEAIKVTRRTLFPRASFARAALRPIANSDDYVKQFVSKSVKKNYGRLARRLAELGDVTYESSDEFSDYNELTQQFLEIESSGWKMKSGTALASSPSTQEFYEELICRSTQAGTASFLSLKLDGKPIAMVSDFQSGRTIFSFKTAFDENYSAFSPGLQIELKRIGWMHQNNIELADSCTAPDNATINRIWGQKLQFQSVVIGLRPGMAQWATRIMPWIQATANKVKQIRS